MITCVVAWAPVATAATSTSPDRATVALFGDSVTESLLIPNPLQDGLAPQLADAEQSLGYRAGGAGLLPANPFDWHFNRSVWHGAGPIPPNGWMTVGEDLAPGFNGPSGYSALTTSPLATATVTVNDPDIDVLYTSTSVPCLFTVTSTGRTWTIDTFRPGPPNEADTSLVLPPGRHALTVHGPNCGFLSFDGIVAQRPVSPGQVQVEVDNDGHSGKLPWIDFNAPEQQAIRDQHYSISVFLYGYLGQQFLTKALSSQYLNAMTTRARIARASGGACLIAQPTPTTAPPSGVALVSTLEQTVARRAGCTYTTVLAHLWSNPAAGEKRGLVLVDGIHPTAAGCKLIARTLAPVIAHMIRVQHQGR